jgi:hypothetical protein
MVMLHRGKSIFLLFLCSLIFIACHRNRNKNEELSIHAQRIINNSENIIGRNNYFILYNSMNDSIQNWIKNKLGNYSYWNSLIKYHLDSVLCINKDKDKLVTAILLRYEGEFGVQDDIHFFYGIKIKDKWYYFEGADITLPREMYQKGIHTPLSFAKLHEIAMKEVFGGYLIKKKKDVGFFKNIFSPEYEYEINDEWFDSHFKNEGICSDCVTEEDFEKIWLYNSQSQWINKKK